MGASATSGSSGDALGESDTVEITGKIMVVAIIFLFMVVVFVLVLHLYAKWFWWNMGQNTAPQPRNRRRRRRRRFVFAPGQDPVIYGNHQIGLDPSVLMSLPVLVFQPEDFKEGLECAVCLCEIVQGEKARLLPKCNHGFHLDCIDMWFQSHSTCPLCRNLVDVVSSESSKPSGSSNVESLEQGSSDVVSGLEAPNFPTNVLVWGNENQVSSVGVVNSLEEEEEEGSSQLPPCSSSSSSSSGSYSVDSRCHGVLVIDIPSEFSSSSLSPRCAEDEVKSPMAATLRSFKRLLSRDKKLSPCSPSSMDVEQTQG